jgi:WD40 repeat protein
MIRQLDQFRLLQLAVRKVYKVYKGNAHSIHLINMTHNECYAKLYGHKDDILDLKFLRKNKNHLLSASEDQTVRLWRLEFPVDKQASNM